MDLVNRIQLSQLKTDNPYVEDYYFHLCTLNRIGSSDDRKKEIGKESSLTAIDGIRKASEKANESV
jgi:hypothetical protein